jgi:hypothetical protein
MRNSFVRRPFIAIILIACCYVFAFMKYAKDSFGEAYYIYLMGVFFVIFLSTLFMDKHKFSTWIAWALIAPALGSACGYAALFIFFLYISGVPQGLRMQELIIAVFVRAYFIGYVWTISLALLVYSYFNFRFVLRRRN